MWIYVDIVGEANEDRPVLINLACVAQAQDAASIPGNGEFTFLVMTDGSDMTVACMVEDIMRALPPGTFTDLRRKDS